MKFRRAKSLATRPASCPLCLAQRDEEGATARGVFVPEGFARRRADGLFAEFLRGLPRDPPARRSSTDGRLRSADDARIAAVAELDVAHGHSAVPTW
jgi:hypothetical protein